MSYFCLRAYDNRRTDRASNGCPVKCHALSAPQSSTGGPLWDRGQTQGLRCCYWCCRCSGSVGEREREWGSAADVTSSHTELLLCPSYSVFLWVCPCPQPLTATARNCEKKKENGQQTRMQRSNRAQCVSKKFAEIHPEYFLFYDCFQIWRNSGRVHSDGTLWNIKSVFLGERWLMTHALMDWAELCIWAKQVQVQHATFSDSISLCSTLCPVTKKIN